MVLVAQRIRANTLLPRGGPCPRIAALSGITGALIGAAATGIFALAAAQVTARSQIESQYLKPQRQTAYLQFMADESALRQVEQDALAEWAHGRRPDEAINEMPALLDKLHKSSDGVLVIGSPDDLAE